MAFKRGVRVTGNAGDDLHSIICHVPHHPYIIPSHGSIKAFSGRRTSGEVRNKLLAATDKSGELVALDLLRQRGVYVQLRDLCCVSAFSNR